MKLITELEKPYTEKQRTDFIVEQNHRNGYEIRETETSLQAWGFDDEELLEQKKERVRQVRSQYYEEYVDWYQSKPLLWEEMSETDKQNIKGYRLYLKDYTDGENWWEQNPKTYEEWLENTNESIQTNS